MSEYQYYEFQAIDRPLTADEMRALRACSTRAEISPTSFVNHYEWGSFKGDERRWMEKYFDAFLYLANWGTHVLSLRFPTGWLSPEVAEPYCLGQSADAREKAGHVIVTFVSEDEEGGEWMEGSGRLASLLPVRAEIARGDLRALYLGWLLCVQSGEIDDNDVEPPVPPNLARPSAALSSLADFLRIDEYLLAAACEASDDTGDTGDTAPTPEVLAAYVAALPSHEKDALLVRLMKGEDARVGYELLSRFQRGQRLDSPRSNGPDRPAPRIVAELFRAADGHRETAARKAAEAKARQKRKAEEARAAYLDGLAGREPELWAEVGQLISTRLPKSYARAMELLVNLRDLAARDGGTDFRMRIATLRRIHARKPNLMRKLEKAGL